MKNDTSLDNAAAQAAGRELTTSVLQRNPLIALASALIGPILGLFTRRNPPNEVRQVRLESYSSLPVSPRRRSRVDATMIEHESNDDRTRSEGTPKRHTSNLNRGGHSHGYSYT